MAPPRTLGAGQLEVAVLDRLRPRRAFRRLAGPLLDRLLPPDDPTADVPHTDDPAPGLHDTLTGDGGPPGPAGGDAAPTPPRATGRRRLAGRHGEVSTADART